MVAKLWLPSQKTRFSSQHQTAANNVCNSSFRGSSALFWLLTIVHTPGTWVYMQAKYPYTFFFNLNVASLTLRKMVRTGHTSNIFAVCIAINKGKSLAYLVDAQLIHSRTPFHF